MKKIVILGIVALIVAALVAAQVPELTPQPAPQSESQPTSTSPAPQPQMSAEDVEAFLDGIVPQQLDRENIAGATISIVEDGKVLFAKGYGYSDIKTKAAVSPEENAVPARIGLEAFHLDGGDADARAGEDRPRPRRKRVP